MDPAHNERLFYPIRTRCLDAAISDGTQHVCHLDLCDEVECAAIAWDIRLRQKRDVNHIMDETKRRYSLHYRQASGHRGHMKKHFSTPTGHVFVTIQRVGQCMSLTALPSQISNNRSCNT